MLRALVVAAFFSFLAVAGAFGVPAPHPSSSPGGSVVAQAGRTWSESEIMEMVEGSTVSKLVSWGARIGYAGALIGAASLIDLGLNYFYDQAQKSTGTSLDDWYRWQNTEQHGFFYTACGYGGTIYISEAGSQGPRSPGESCSNGWSLSEGSAIAERLFPDYFTGGTWNSTPIVINPGGHQAYEYRVPSGRPSLYDWIQNHSDAGDGLRNSVVPSYSQHETDDPNTYPQTFPNPFPGVSLDPPPNGNQWWDDPYYSPTTDTDGDGWPDWMEERLGSKAGNAGNYPDPNADPDGDGYTNDQERAAGTDPADPNSHPSGDGSPSQDTDGDGIADSADPCPTDPTNSCNYTDPSQEDDVKIPTDYARENTLQAAASTLTGIASTLTQIQSNTANQADNSSLAQESTLQAASTTLSNMAASLSTLASRSQPTDYAKDATISALADQLSDISDTLADLDAKPQPDDYAKDATLQDISTKLSTLATSLDTLASTNAKDATLQQTNVLLGQIAANTTPKDEDDTTTPPDYDADNPTFAQWSPAAPLASAWSSVTTHFTDTLTSLEASMSDKLPFALGSWIPVLSGVTGTPSCAAISITLLGIETNLGWCDSVFYHFITGTVRAGVLVLLLLGFYFASARTLAWS